MNHSGVYPIPIVFVNVGKTQSSSAASVNDRGCSADETGRHSDSPSATTSITKNETKSSAPCQFRPILPRAPAGLGGFTPFAIPSSSPNNGRVTFPVSCSSHLPLVQDQRRRASRKRRARRRIIRTYCSIRRGVSATDESTDSYEDCSEVKVKAEMSSVNGDNEQLGFPVSYDTAPLVQGSHCSSQERQTFKREITESDLEEQDLPIIDNLHSVEVKAEAVSVKMENFWECSPELSTIGRAEATECDSSTASQTDWTRYQAAAEAEPYRQNRSETAKTRRRGDRKSKIRNSSDSVQGCPKKSHKQGTISGITRDRVVRTDGHSLESEAGETLNCNRGPEAQRVGEDCETGEAGCICHACVKACTDRFAEEVQAIVDAYFDICLPDLPTKSGGNPEIQ
ncbi:hypothetical protein BaRGS_00021158 [Batillaria attramentaria]|uniref:Uncharacterized protein n=1 Tax=Batillaria attramentaria TaxID=370345 RepID=A0ABD0KKP2_9CAEN